MCELPDNLRLVFFIGNEKIFRKISRLSAGIVRLVSSLYSKIKVLATAQKS